MDCSLSAPPSMGFSRQEYWSGVPLPSPYISRNVYRFKICVHTCKYMYILLLFKSWTQRVVSFCPSLSPRVFSDSCPLSQWCYLTISSSATSWLCSKCAMIAQKYLSFLNCVVVQSLSHVRLFATPWTAARQASLSFNISWSLLKLMSIELVMLTKLLKHPQPGRSFVQHSCPCDSATRSFNLL